ncbi:phosphoribosylglycinamide formyltransferase [Ammoniphilus resinae]|uniref:Phosphoribosylglycinamide formyltransferase n=1 Tax=Ammoniphilus resinae TaxID=861532 RepID=A0ABS4GIJ5_9BACL|nr:phosphoribosylglycinamide formyltransferase [Ammoniphilus resinae]MBP1930076.1 phosphoribosylglycinamide formyltransferase-1 [Ammoniphilus resinae]
MKIAVFASGSGSNFSAMMGAIRADKLPGVEVALLVCDRPGALVEGRAEQESIPVFSFQPKQHADKLAYEQVILQELKKKQVEWIILAGYMRLIGDTLLEAYQGRIINLHPSLLPAFTGKDAIGQALEYGVKVTGVTVHFVDAGMDTGPIIAQRVVPILEGDTRETLTKRIQEQEHQLLPEVVRLVQEGKVKLIGRKVGVQ